MSGPEVSGVSGAAEGAAHPNGPASRNSLQFRLALPYVVLTVFVLGGLAIFVGSRIENIALDGLSESLEDQALIAADSIQRQVAAGAGTPEIEALVDQLGQRVEARRRRSSHSPKRHA